ncbi:MAG: polyprenol monophosphomannose synthase [Anaerolineae bacterium]|jgi:dolichol-phosphate mannosyltransferase|nr:polyprenol monophosphomannose synthase [Anaerolineae bacterium]
MKITIIIPTFNEAGNIKKLIPMLLDLPIHDLTILVVDDNSQDGTGNIADSFAKATKRVKVLHRAGKLGLGTAYIQGFQIALNDGAEAVIQMDADFSHPPQKVPELVEAIAKYDVVIGSRYVQGGDVDREWAAWRKALSAFGNYYARTILGLPTQDVTGGFRIYRADTLRAMPIQQVRSNGYIYQVEMTYIAAKLGFSIGEIPIYFAEREWGDSKMSFKIQLEAALRTWKLLWDYRKLKPD